MKSKLLCRPAKSTNRSNHRSFIKLRTLWRHGAPVTALFSASYTLFSSQRTGGKGPRLLLSHLGPLFFNRFASPEPRSGSTLSSFFSLFAKKRNTIWFPFSRFRTLCKNPGGYTPSLRAIGLWEALRYNRIRGILKECT